MTKVIDIFEQYKLIPGLQLHQLRVAAVAWQICDALKIKIDTETVINASLLHDMGNIIKSDLNIFPEFIEEKGMDYWQAVKDEYIQKYGNDEHHATIEIAKELGMPAKVINAINSIGFKYAQKNESTTEFEPKIASYADLRVGPYGVLSLNKRLIEGEKRYQGNKRWINDEASYKAAVISLHNLEEQIFQKTNLKPNDITDQSIKPYFEKLQNYQI